MPKDTLEDILENDGTDSTEIPFNCLQDGCPFLKRVGVIEEISLKNREYLENLTKIQVEHMSHISANTKSISDHLSTYASENQKLVEIIAGKKQVPLSVFTLVILTMCISGILLIAAVTNMQLVADSNSIKIMKEIKISEGMIEENRKKINEQQ